MQYISVRLTVLEAFMFTETHLLNVNLCLLYHRKAAEYECKVVEYEWKHRSPKHFHNLCQKLPPLRDACFTGHCMCQTAPRVQGIARMHMRK